MGSKTPLSLKTINISFKAWVMKITMIYSLYENEKVVLLVYEL